MSEAQAPSVNIDGVNYDLNSLSDDAKAQIASLQIVDQKVRELQQELAILQTARNAYLAALKAALPTS